MCSVIRCLFMNLHILEDEARLLPKKNVREPFGLPKLEIGSPRYISRSPRLFSQIQTMSYETYSLDWKGVVPPSPGDSNIKKVGMPGGHSLIWPIRGRAAGQGMVVGLLCPEQGIQFCANLS